MNSQNKIIALPRLKGIIARLRKRKKIAFTNGCFDILHFGHINYLEKAKKPGRLLIVAVNSDASVKKLKGKGRPVNGQRERTKDLAALSCVDFVTVFGEQTPEKTIHVLKPDILIKGADWKGKEVAGARFVRSCGGKVEFVPYVNGFSTTKIIQAIAKSR